MTLPPRRLLAGALLLLGGCGALGYVPVVGSFVPPPGQAEAMRSQQDMMLNFTFRPNWKNLIDDHKYKSALAYIDAQKETLGETHEKTFIDDTYRECKTYLNDRLARFRRNLSDVKSQRDLAALKADDFASAFSLPAPDELITTPAAYPWARSFFGDLEDFRGRKPAGESLLKGVAGSASLPPDDDGEHRWFDSVEALAFQAVGDAVRADVALAQDAPRAARDEAKGRVDGLLAKWTDLAKALDGKPRARVDDHQAQLAKLPAGFPKDLSELDGIDVAACLAATSPENELQKAERTLKNLEGRGGVSRESRQRLYTLIVTVVSLRAFLTGRDEADVAAELKGYGEKLRNAGGPTDASGYGSRVQAVFEALR